jgi:hypothetical protein
VSGDEDGLPIDVEEESLASLGGLRESDRWKPLRVPVKFDHRLAEINRGVRSGWQPASSESFRSSCQRGLRAGTVGKIQ